MRLTRAIERTRQRWQRPRCPEPPPDLKGRRVLLVYGFPRFGEVVLLAPLLQALHRAGAADPVQVVLRGAGAATLSALRVPVRPIDGEGPVREVKADVAVDLTHRADFDGHAWLAASGAAWTAGFVPAFDHPRARTLHQPVLDRRPWGLNHWIDSSMEPFAPFRLQPKLPLQMPPLPPRRDDGWPTGEGPRLLLVPGARDPDRRWPSWVFEALGRRHVQARRGRVLVVGAPSEASLVERVQRSVGRRCRRYLGGLTGLVERVRRADAVVSNDTGTMQVALTLGIPTVCLFSTMRPEVWGPHPKSTAPAWIVSGNRDGFDPSSLDDRLDAVLEAS